MKFFNEKLLIFILTDTVFGLTLPGFGIEFELDTEERNEKSSCVL